jgi:hypothetical protein
MAGVDTMAAVVSTVGAVMAAVVTAEAIAEAVLEKNGEKLIIRSRRFAWRKPTIHISYAESLV